jgi:glyoxylase-like metal-dependent hydrolase (beta-lactamase superfamily II)
MKNAIFFFVAVVAVGLFANSSAIAQEEELTVSATQLRGPLHLLQGRGGNVVASIGLDGVLLIDNDYAQYGAAYEEVLADLSQSLLSPSFVLNTHWHGDHTGNNEFWGIRGAVMIAHSNVRTRLAIRQEISALDMVVEPSADIALPLVTFSDSIALHFNGSDIEVQHYPAGHTDGDSVIYYLNENVIHTGDLFFKDVFPFIDLSSGGSVKGYIANVEAILKNVDDETLIVPGHGSIAGKADLERFLQMLEATTAAVTASLAGGMSVDDVVAKGLGEEYVSWGKGFIKEAQWIQTIAAGQE